MAVTSPSNFELPGSKSAATISSIPRKAKINTGILFLIGASERAIIEMITAKNGWVLPKNIALAIVVSFNADIQVIKCRARNIPASMKCQ